jgi:hypothetical protein
MILIERSIVFIGLVILFSSLFLSAGCSQSESNKPDVDVYTFPSKTDEPSTTSPQTQQPVDQEIPSPSADSTNDYNERSIVVDEHNNVFSIGIPAGYEEKREIEAQKPVDIWFEYLPQEIELEVDGIKVERSGRWEFKIHYSSSVTKLSYSAKNTSSEYLSYNLHIVPSTQGEAISVVVKEWWSP